MAHVKAKTKPTGLSEWGNNIFVGVLDKSDKGAVELWENRRSKKQMVFKIIKHSSNGNKERDIMLQLRDSGHPNIINLLLHEDHWTERFMMLALPYFPQGDLYDWTFRKFKGHDPPENMIWDAFKQLSEAIYFLHSQHPPILHLDIKPENVFVDSRAGPEAIRFVLADFGYAEFRSAHLYFKDCYAGSEQYLPPENNPSFAFDVWQVGATIHHVALGKRPVDLLAETIPKMSDQELMTLFDPDRTGSLQVAKLNAYKRGNPRRMQKEKWGERYSVELYSLLKNTLAEIPEDRPKSNILPSLVFSMRADWMKRLAWERLERERLEQAHRNRRMERGNHYAFSTDDYTCSEESYSSSSDGDDWPTDHRGYYMR